MARILVIVEDTDYNAVIASELVTWGHQVESVPNGRNASARLAEAAFDLILTDIVMPATGGIEFFNWSSSGAHPPILAMSDCSSDQAISLLKVALLLGADGSLRKPFTRQELRDVVTTLLGGDNGVANHP